MGICTERWTDGQRDGKIQYRSYWNIHRLGSKHDGMADPSGRIRCPNALNIMGSGGNYGGPQALRYSACSSQFIADTMR